VDYQEVWANRGIVISESCGCGASFQAERSDELKLLNTWRTSHKCKPSEGNLAIVDSSRSELANYHPIGFSPFPDIEEDDDSKRI
jgi:hypothetical protein